VKKAATKKKTATKKKRTAATKKVATKKVATKKVATTLEDLLGGKPATAFASRTLGRKAHWRWNKGQLHEAFVLFDAAMQRARAEGDRNDARSWANRAAVTLFRSKRDPAAARARLRAVIDHYRSNASDINDRHFVDWAMTSLLEDAADQASSAAAFTKAYRAGVAEVTPLLRDHWSDRSAPFPRIHVERLIDAARRVGALDIVAELEALG
jgi:hypothetical protein